MRNLSWTGLVAGNGGAEGNRTPDLYIANVALSQLSYCPFAADLGGRNMWGTAIQVKNMANAPFSGRFQASFLAADLPP